MRDCSLLIDVIPDNWSTPDLSRWFSSFFLAVLLVKILLFLNMIISGSKKKCLPFHYHRMSVDIYHVTNSCMHRDTYLIPWSLHPPVIFMWFCVILHGNTPLFTRVHMSSISLLLLIIIETNFHTLCRPLSSYQDSSVSCAHLIVQIRLCSNIEHNFFSAPSP